MVLINLLNRMFAYIGKKYSEVMVFQGEGEKWEVSIPNEVILKNKKILSDDFSL